MKKSNNPWAIFEDQALDLFPDTGFFREYINYAKDAMDSPIIYHLGCLITGMATVSSNVDIRIETDRPGEYYYIPSQFWATIVGQSSVSRKSEAMRLIVRMIERALIIDDKRKHVRLPSDGSIEAWIKHMVESGGLALMYRTEFASMLDQAGRSYSAGLKTWLLELWDGDPYLRKSLGQGEFLIERPRMNLLGGVPPSIYKAKTARSDWASGLLARMVNFPGVRERRYRTPATNDRTELKLTQWMSHVVAKSTGYIHIPRDLMILQDDWFVKNIEEQQSSFHPEVVSCYNRFSPMIYRFAAYFALAEETSPILGSLDDRMLLQGTPYLTIKHHHMVQALKIADVIKDNIVELFADMLMTKENEEVRAICWYLESCPGGGDTLKGIQENSGVSLGFQAMRRLLGAMVDEGTISQVRLSNLPKNSVLREQFKSKGQPPILYQVPV